MFKKIPKHFHCISPWGSNCIVIATTVKSQEFRGSTNQKNTYSNSVFLSISHPTFSRSSFIPKTLPSLSRLSPLQDLYLLEIFPFLKSSTSSQKSQTSVHWDLRLLLRSSILLTFIICNAPFSASIYTARSAIPPNSASNYNCYNKSNMWKSCSYSSPEILPPQLTSFSGLYDPPSPRRRGFTFVTFRTYTYTPTETH